MTGPRVGVVTASVLPFPDPDEPALVATLRGLGARVSVVAWDDPAVDWGTLDVAVVRSTWNYVPRRDDFVAWAERTERVTRLLNPAAVLRANSDKAYLGELGRRGVPIVPTTFLDLGASAADAVSSALGAGLGDVVVKPRVSAGSFATERFDLERDGSTAVAFLGEHLAVRPMMLQPYQPTIATSGERSLVFIDGQLSHHVRKSPRFSGEPVVISDALPFEADLTDLAQRVLASIGDALLYARVDLLRDADGQARLMELELVEPYLMLGKHPPAVDALAGAIVRRAREPR